MPTNESAVLNYTSTEGGSGTVAFPVPQLTYTIEDEGGNPDPDPPAPDWEVSKSKTATNLDSSYESQITLSLPAAGYAPKMDVVFVVDSTAGERWNTYRAQIISVIDELNTLQNIDISAGFVTFGNGTTERIALQPLSTGKTQFDEIPEAYNILNHWLSPWMESSGTNIQAGVRAGREMLDSGRDDAEKYLILLTDGGAFYWLDEDGASVTKPYKSGRFFDSTAQEDSHMYNNNLTGMYSIASGSFAAFREQYGTQVEAFNKSATVCTKGTKEDGMGDAYIYSTSDWSNKEVYPFTNMEQGTYNASQEMVETAADGVHLITVGAYDYYPDQAAVHTVSNLFLDWTGEVGDLYKVNTGDADDSMEKAFAGVQDSLIQLVDAESKVVDVIGYGDDYNFDFINSIDKLTLTEGGVELAKAKIDDTTYGFGPVTDEESEATTYRYVLHYYDKGEDGESDECIVWDINVPVTKDATVQLTYSVKLTNPKTAAGTYGQYDADGSKGYDGPVHQQQRGALSRGLSGQCGRGGGIRQAHRVLHRQRRWRRLQL